MGNIEIKNGLKATPKDTRDYSFGAVFGLPKLEELPEEFIVAVPLRIKDQGNTLECTAYTTSSVSEDQEGVELDPKWQAKFISDIMGHDINEEGADLRTACKSATDVGSVEASEDVSLIDLAKAKAEKHRKQAYFKVSGQYDTFDNIRACLWANRGQKRSIVSGIGWRQSWTSAPDGVIPETYEQEASGHAIKIFGWNKNGLLIQNSYSEGIGGLLPEKFGSNIKGGIFYLPRKVANRELTYGAYTFTDMPPMTKEEIIKISQYEQLNLIQKILFLMTEWIKEIFKPTQVEVKPTQIEPSVPVIDSIPLEPVIPTYLWDTKENIRHSIRVICDECGLNVFQKDLICRICECESGYDPKAKRTNSPKSIDRGLFQINSYWHSSVTDDKAYNPEFSTRWAIQALKDGKVKTFWSASAKCWNNDGKYSVFLT